VVDKVVFVVIYIIQFNVKIEIKSRFLFKMIPLVWFTEGGNTGTYLLITMSIITIICYILGSITQNHSQVDKLWSFLPPIYCLIVVLSTPLNPRVLLMNTLAWMWGLRLTYNFARKGGYTWAGEDYRWPILREMINNRLIFELFNLTFIAIFQNILLLFIACPIYYIASHQTAPLNLWDLVCTLLFVFLFVIEVTADQQQWEFHGDKEAKQSWTKDGFLQTGLFKYSRHPNFFSEICLWWVFYAFTLSVRPFSYVNWTILGTISLTLLINGSTTFTESITSKKYPKYKRYQRTTSRLIPWLPAKKAQ
jgi:steroid 5-alpha reductase family enzyme